MTANNVALQQARELPLHVSSDLCKGKTYIVTGANVGLGLEAARHLVAVGAAKVILAVRNVAAGEAARESIEASTGITGVAEVWRLDLADYGSVRSFARQAIDKLERIEAVIENAAVAGAAGTAEGHKLDLTVNVLSTFLLAILLLPKLRSDAAKFNYQPRLSFVSSGTALDLGEYWKQIAEDPIRKMDDDENVGMKM
jgi:NAD(P)-dependent dehydrogenase (short-subunit alcohol dehydrogenase family)